MVPYLSTETFKKNIFLSEYGIKLAKDRIFANVLPNMLQLTDYEEQYMTPAEIKKRGFQVKFSTKSIYFSNLSCMILNPNIFFTI